MTGSIEFHLKVKDACDKLVREHHIAVDNLTEKQVAEALRQALCCGDFTRLVRVDNEAQCVIYIPFLREQKLEFEIARLRTLLEEHRIEWRLTEDPDVSS